MNRRSFIASIAALMVVPQQLFAAAKKRTYKLFVGQRWDMRATDILTNKTYFIGKDDIYVSDGGPYRPITHTRQVDPEGWK